MNKKAYWKTTKLDLICGCFSLLGLFLWQVTKMGNIAILFSIFADLSAGIPTLIKSFRFPETENWHGFFASFLNAVIALFTIKTWTFAFFAFPLYIFLYDLTATLLIKLRLGKKLSRVV